jgi:lysophospholipase L1-like esterase
MRTWFVLVALSVAACGGNEDPFAGDDDTVGGDDDDTTVAPDAAPTTGADAAPPRACAPTPKRVIVLGDSITACSVIGGPQNANCVSKQFFDYVKANYAPEAEYVNRAVGGARLRDLAGQIDGIPEGDGPNLVLVYMGGNDLAPYIFQSDADAMAAWDDINGELNTEWTSAFEKLRALEGGSTVIMNTQYNPFDDCTAPPYNLSATKINILHMYNARLGELAAAQGDAAVLVDQFTPYLGHGHHYSVSTCPHYAAGMTPFMEDLIHANAAGNAQLASVVNGGADRLYGDTCEP